MEKRLTPGSFDRSGIRQTLRFEHGFVHHDLERTKRIVSAAIEHVESKTHTSSGLRAGRLGMAESFLSKSRGEWGKLPEEHKEALKEWKKLSPSKREAVLGALKGHFGLEEKPELPKEEPKIEQKVEPKKFVPPPRVEPRSMPTETEPPPPIMPYQLPPAPLVPPPAANDNEGEIREAA